MKFPENEINDFANSWDKSMKECKRLMQFIIGSDEQQGLLPHQVQDTISVNEARRLITGLIQPLAEISQNINDNLELIDRHRSEVESKAENRKSLLRDKEYLYMPIIEIELNDLDEPRTVCTSLSCVDNKEIARTKKVIYNQVCCDQCKLIGVPQEIIGDSELKKCEIFDEAGNCLKCQCNYIMHMHIYYETKLVEKRLINQNLKKVQTYSDAQDQAKNVLREMKNRCDKLQFEKKKIVQATSKFADFLRKNAIIPQDDSFKVIIELSLIKISFIKHDTSLLINLFLRSSLF